ncbi:four helix bundle protein [Candidatus Daviesbacteria bacterium]|nr:four helix bundle protein [Candidatus Daviesbacteria bacterium]
MKISSYKELIVWQKAMDLVREIYLLTEKFPKDEIYGLASQMQRAAVAIPSNIAEGYLRGHRKEYIQFLLIALGSAAELETQILICKPVSKFNRLDFAKAESLLTEVMKMLYVMSKRVKNTYKVGGGGDGGS